MKVEIKERKLTAGNRSLYLEYYEKGFRKKENLHLYLVPDDAPNARKINGQTYNKAREIQAQRILNPPSFESKKKKPEENERAKTMTWLQWCDDYIQSAIDSENCKKMIQHKGVVRKRIAAYLKQIRKPDILLKDVNRDTISGLFKYMREDYRNPGQIKADGGKLADFTLVLFEETVKAIFNKAVRDGLIPFNPIQDLAKEERFHVPDKHREYLTTDELKRFLAVETQTQAEQTVQKAFGFSCMTGLRLGDMQRLRWSDIKTIGEVQAVSIIQHKTKRLVTVPLNELALSLLPPRPDNGEDNIIFPLVKKPDNVAKYVRRIKEKAGIEKDFTYHSSRHSAATLAITAGAELYSVSKILGHGSIVSTQVYASVNMEKKAEAVNLANGIFG
ncbi:site-specific integrase [Bacteroides thetaiotaomicron]|jgi:integrase|uniref:tyrosine-type recombinase/integrase n=1 Tax=Bacteroidaceae TaxID=815 RepID=UPI002165A730|nr:site-specific integrase [Bacteroides thetaiotaomicron]MCS3331491.1 site-specific integrase [Bacteroides thetaiotaomicron]